MKLRKKILIISVLMLLIFAASYTVFIAPLLEKEEWVYKEATVERGTLTAGVTESGTLEYGVTYVEYDLNLEISNDEEDDDEEDTVQRYLEVEEVYVAQGQRIQAGDALMKFTEDSITDVRNLLENALAEAKAEYSEAEAEYDLSVLEAETDYRNKQIAGQYAQSIYNYKNEAINSNISALQAEINHRTENVAALEEKVAEARENYNEALESYTAAKAGYDEADTSSSYYFELMQDKYLSAQTTYQNAKSALEQAEEALQENANQIDTLQSELSTATAIKTIEKLKAEEEKQEAVISSENAEITYQARLESLKEELNDAAEDKTKLENQLQDFEAFVGADGILYAEGSGIVTESGYKAGDILSQQGVLVSYAEPENMTISVDMAQEDVVDISVGQQVEVEFTAYEGQIYSGSILSIDTTATSANSNTVSYTVVIGVEGDTSLLYGGMVADITFVKEQKKDVLYLSQKAIVTENGKTYVYKKTAQGDMELTEVQIGLSNGSEVEIQSGLDEGDTIYIASRVSSEAEVKDGTAAQTTQSTDQQDAGGMQFPNPEDGSSGGQFNMPGNGMPDRQNGNGEGRK